MAMTSPRDCEMGQTLNNINKLNTTQFVTHLNSHDCGPRRLELRYLPSLP